MSLLPYYDDTILYNRNRSLENYFRALDDQFLQPFVPTWITPTWPTHVVEDLTRSTDISLDHNNFRANIDVNQFKPEEISIKVTPDNTLTVEGKHKEVRDEHGYVSRHFVRRYVLPKNCNADKLKSELSSDGVLTITAPRQGDEEENSEEGVTIKEVSVKQTGRPIKWLGETTRKVKDEELKHLKSKLLG